MDISIQERLKDLRVECGLTLVGAIFNWRWVTSPEGERPNSPGRVTYDLFGQGGYRVFMGVLGVVIIACGIFFLFAVR